MHNINDKRRTTKTHSKRVRFAIVAGLSLVAAVGSGTAIAMTSGPQAEAAVSATDMGATENEQGTIVAPLSSDNSDFKKSNTEVKKSTGVAKAAAPKTNPGVSVMSSEDSAEDDWNATISGSVAVDDDTPNVGDKVHVTVTYGVSGSNATFTEVNQTLTSLDGLSIDTASLSTKIDGGNHATHFDGDAVVGIGTVNDGSTVTIEYDVIVGNKDSSGTKLNGKSFTVNSNAHFSTTASGQNDVTSKKLRINNPQFSVARSNSTDNPSAGDTVHQSFTVNLGDKLAGDGAKVATRGAKISVVTTNQAGEFPTGLQYTNLKIKQGATDISTTATIEGGTITLNIDRLELDAGEIRIDVDLVCGDSTSIDLNNQKLSTKLTASALTAETRTTNTNTISIQAPSMSVTSHLSIPVGGTSTGELDGDVPTGDDDLPTGDVTTGDDTTDTGADTDGADTETGTDTGTEAGGETTDTPSGETGGETTDDAISALPNLDDLNTTDNVINVGDRATITADIANDNKLATAKNLTYSDSLDQASIDGGAYIDVDSIRVIMGDKDVTDSVVITPVGDGNATGFSITADGGLQMPAGTQHMYVIYDVVAGTPSSDRLRGVTITTNPQLTGDNFATFDSRDAATEIVVASANLVATLDTTTDQVPIGASTTYSLTVQNRATDTDSVAKNVVIAGSLSDDAAATGYQFSAPTMKVYKVEGSKATDVTDGVKITWTEGKQFVIETGSDIKAASTAAVRPDSPSSEDEGDATGTNTAVDEGADANTNTDANANSGDAANANANENSADAEDKGGVDVDELAAAVKEGYVVTYDGSAANVPEDTYSSTLTSSVILSADNAAYSTVYKDVDLIGKEVPIGERIGRGTYDDNLVGTGQNGVNGAGGAGGVGGVGGDGLSATGDEVATAVGAATGIGAVIAGIVYSVRRRLRL